MNSINSVKIALLLAVLLSILLGGCNQDQKISLERVPQYYRDCVSKVTDLPKGSITYQEALRLLATLRTSELRLSRCGKQVIAWADAQVAAYGKQ